MHRSSRSPLLTLLCLSLLLQGCQTWARYDVPPETAPPSAVAGGRPVRVSMRDGTELLMRGTRVIGDSIVGDGTPAAGRIAVPVADVRTVEELRTNRIANTVLIAAGAVVALAGVALFALYQAMDP